jgi:hypothetical protein
MTKHRFRVHLACAVLTAFASLVLVATAAAQAGNQTATQTYLAYRAAFDKAKTIDEILPFMAAERRKQVESTPAGERAKMFDMVKAFGAMSQVKVAGETKTANGVSLTVTGVGSDKEKMNCTVTMLREANVWKIERESCKN